MCKEYDENKPISSIFEYLKWVELLQSQGRYVFRGVSSKTYKIEASTYRRLINRNVSPDNNGDGTDESDIEPDNNGDSLINNNVHNPNRLLHINKEMIDEANLHRHGWEDEVAKSDLNLLADLQHKGAATCLIDFTNNPLVALWMACRASSKGKIEGKVYAVDISSHLKFKPVSIEDSLNNSISDFFEYDEIEGYQLYQWQPNSQNNRMRAQQSIFLFGGARISDYKICLIDENEKQSILNSLKYMAGITGDNLFPDTEGFASQRSESKPYIDHDNPNDSLATSYLERGRQASSDGKIDEAINSFTTGISIQPSEEHLKDLYKERALVYYNQREYKNAISDCREVLENDPTHISALLLQGRAYSDSEPQQTREAIRVFEKITSLNTESAEAYFRLAMLQIENDKRKALENLNNAIQVDSTNPISRYWRGKLKYEAEQYKEAIIDFDEAIKYKSDNSNTYYLRGMCKYTLATLYDDQVSSKDDVDVALEQIKEAKNDFDLAIILETNDPFPYFYRGICKRRLGDTESAKSDLLTAQVYAVSNNNTRLQAIIEDSLSATD